tara:strand:- start:7872 stop:9416 length:1545 start_codon:yes stop_codon:yes gene_type:complete
MKKLEFITTFSSEIKPLVPEDKDKYLAMASLMDIADFIPDIDVEKNIDLLPIAFNACVVNRVNKNDDVIDSKTALAMAEHFVNKPINIEHDRHRVLGTILSVGFSEFGTDKKLTAEEAGNVKGPFNITLGGVLWRVVNSELTDIIEEASDPTSEFYQRISASWELGFSEYEPILLEVGEKNLENSVLIEDNSKVIEIGAELRALGGTGEYEGKKVYRKVYGEVVPLGIGLTENPAADVIGVATKTNREEELEEAASEENNLKNDTPVENNISHFKENNVIENKDSTMEINSIKDITDETLKEVSASSVAEFIQSELEKASEEYAAQKTALEDAVKAGAEENVRLQKEQEEMKEDFHKVKTTLDSLEAEKIEREKLDKFNERMSVLDDEYLLEDEERKVIASDIKEMDEENFSTYAEKLAVLLKSKSKAAVAERKEQEEAIASTEEAKVEEPQAEAKEEAASSEETTSEEQIVEEIVDQAEEQKEEIPLTTQAEEPTLHDKYKGAFNIDNFDIKL